MDRPKPQPVRIPGIDGLRAVAVLAVIAYHLDFAFLQGGFVGVDVFFVISGYVVCGSLLRDSPTRFFPFIGAFYVRRLLRIYPALIALLLCGGVLSTLFIPDAFLSANNAPTGLWAFFGLSNFALIWYQNSYFSPSNDYNPYAHTWSLGVEEQFYFIFPLILFCLLRTRDKPFLIRRLAGLLLPALLLLSLGYSAYETASRHDRAYFLLPSRFWELAAGAVLCLAHQRHRLLPSSAGQAAALTSVGLVTVVLSTVFVTPVHFPFPLAIPPVVGTVLCIAGVVSASATGIGHRLLTSRPVVWIGRISYSLYLWHWLVIVMFRWTIGAESLLASLLALGLTFLFATVSYYLIEISPLLPHAALQRRKLATITAGVCLILASHYAFRKIAGDKIENLISQSTVIRNRSDWYPHLETAQAQPEPVTPKRWHNRQLFSVGDSHAFTYGGMFRMLQKEDGVSVHIDSFPGQAIGSLVSPVSPSGAERQMKTLETLRQMSRPGDVVLLASLRVNRLCEQWGTEGFADPTAGSSGGDEAARELAVEQAREFIARLRDLKLNVVVNAPTPVFKAPPFRGSDWFNRMNPVNRPGFTMESDFFLRHRAKAMQSIGELQQSNPEVQVWDPFPVLCPGPVYSAFEGSGPDSKPLFFDGDHLSDYGGRKLYPSFKAVLETFWN